jgi:hypothetical protein
LSVSAKNIETVLKPLTSETNKMTEKPPIPISTRSGNMLSSLSFKRSFCNVNRGARNCHVYGESGGLVGSDDFTNESIDLNESDLKKPDTEFHNVKLK